MLVIALIATGCSATATTTREPASAAPDPRVVAPTTEPTTTDDGTQAAPSPTATAGPAATVQPTAEPTATTQGDDTSADDSSTRPELVWSPCSGGECTTVPVPLDYDDPSGATIDVAVARAPARNSAERIGSMFVNFGGPGGESTSIFASATALLGLTFERFDIVTWDPRGIGRTARLDCDVLGEEFPTVELDPSDGLADEIAEQETNFGQVVDCAIDSGPIIDHLGTVNVARDMEQVRVALGDEPMNYLGLSYGTQIGWVYATLFGASVRSMILDGAVPGGSISASDFTAQLAAFQRTFDYFDEVCAREPTCRQGDEGLAAAVERIAAELAQDPIQRGNGESFGAVEFRQSILFAMYQRPDVIGPILTQWIEDADNGSATGLAQLLTAGGANSTPGGYQAVLCADGGDFPSAAGQEADYQATLAASETFGILGEAVRCDLWPGEKEEPPPIDTSDAPTILVVGSTLDPATPYESAVLLDQQLADSVLLTVEGGGHTAVLDDPCAGQIAADYANDLTIPEPGTFCFTPGLFGVQLVNQDPGVRIETVVVDSAAQAAGLQVGDILVAVDDQALVVASDIPGVRAGTPSNWLIERDGQERTITVTPDIRPWN